MIEILDPQDQPVISTRRDLYDLLEGLSGLARFRVQKPLFSSLTSDEQTAQSTKKQEIRP
jgi:hypothetical protein